MIFLVLLAVFFGVKSDEKCESFYVDVVYHKTELTEFGDFVGYSDTKSTAKTPVDIQCKGLMSQAMDGLTFSMITLAHCNMTSAKHGSWTGDMASSCSETFFSEKEGAGSCTGYIATKSGVYCSLTISDVGATIIPWEQHNTMGALLCCDKPKF